MKRSLIIKHNNGEENKELEIGKAVSVKSDKDFIFFEKMNDNKWRLTFSESTVENFSVIESFFVKRED
jgi:hypothetical protein